ncbi:MAG: hypothetical protein JRH13_10050 [Deltaproteobacteria bacterium]|nr:hypothetical protein [Deltaproteobacteria bacterium]MBW2129694.1 hypothetical protein [Deltaproteobacteria bacterium]MBW2304650.1 hypothetical protein [Deltaproteobacteria bacterium]
MQEISGKAKIRLKKLPREALRRWIWVVIFGLAFAWVESAVVVYLREIYYGGGFSFPIFTGWQQNGRFATDPLMGIEFGRELATVVMLTAVGCSAGKNTLQRFCLFMIAFGVWDIFYYVWLWVMVSWPESLMTWDLLFFIPLPWVGPVITPLLIAAAMSAAGTLLFFCDEKGLTFRWRWYDWVIELGCGLLLIVAFCWDWKNIVRYPDGMNYSGIPTDFAWWLYLPAFSLSVIYFAFRFYREIINK